MKVVKNKHLIYLLLILCISLCIQTGCKDSKYKVTFMIDNEFYTEVFATYGTPIEMPEEPVKTGYTFDGWFTDNQFNPNIYSNFIQDKDIIVYAHFIPKSYNITLNANGGNCDITDINVVYDKEFTLPIPTKTNHTFMGWFDGNTLINSNVWIYDNTIELYAKWNYLEYDLNKEGLDLILAPLIPGQQRFIGQINVQLNSTNNNYVFVKIDCENKDYLKQLSFNTTLFKKYEDVYYYLAPATTSIVFADTVSLSLKAGNEFQNIGDTYLHFSIQTIQSSGMTLESAYKALYSS